MKKWVYSVLALTMIGGALLLFYEYNKFGAVWGPIPVVLVGLILAVLVILLLHKVLWFSDRTESAPTKFAVILAVAFILSAFLGIYFTEPTRAEKTAYQIQEERMHYVYANSRTGYWYTNTFLYVGNNSSSSSSSLDLDNMDGEAAALLLVIVVAAAAVIGSALISHFWVAALIVLAALMADFAGREWDVFVHDQYERRR